MASELSVSTISRGESRIIRVGERRLNNRNAAAFKEILVTEARKCPEVLLVDVSSVSSMDSSGLGALVAGLKELGRGGQMALCGVQSEVARLLHMTNMKHVFKIYSNPEKAISEIS